MIFWQILDLLINTITGVLGGTTIGLLDTIEQMQTFADITGYLAIGATIIALIKHAIYAIWN